MLVRVLLLMVFSEICFFGIATPLPAEVIGFEFSGTVTFRPTFPLPAESPWSINILDQSTVSGRFLYDTQSAVTHTYAGACDGTCAGYRQQIDGGFYATFEADYGPVRIQANDYLVGIFDDLPSDTGSQDTFFVSFDSGLSPPLTHPLIVDGAEKEEGLFNVSLVAGSTLFPDTSLPSNIELNEFDDNYLATAGAVSDYSSLFPDVLFSITSLQKVPPTSGDYNFDLQVNENDYQRWKTLYNSTLDLTADGNHDGIVDAADYVVWRNNLSTSIGSQVPEPGTTCLFVSAIGMLSQFALLYRSNGF